MQIERQCVCQECAQAFKVVQERERKEKHRDAPPPLRALRHTDNCCLLKHFCHFLPFSIQTFAIFSSSCCCSRCLFVVFNTFELLPSPSLPSFSWMMHHPCLLSGEIFHFLTFSIRSSISQTFYRGKLLTRRAGINLKTNIFRMEAE